MSFAPSYIQVRSVSTVAAFLFCLFVHILVPSVAYSETIDNHPYPDLSSEPQWRKLLHYRDNSSVIESASFFLSAKGQNSAQHEYQATLNALSKPNSSTHCQFPARYLWLKQKLGTDFGLSLAFCDDFNQWKNKNPADSISLIYVTGYLGNPASFFGHLLMKFNEKNGLSKEVDLLDIGVNFGADADPDDNPVKYVTYGLFGGYNASFTNTNYYQHTNTYAEHEQRELWEYELNLTQWEINLLQAHLWELQDTVFNYYFLTQNCSTAMAYFVGIVLDESLLIEYQPWDMPINVFNRLTKVTHNNEPLVKKIHQRQSKYTRIHNKYRLLTENEKRWVLSINNDISLLEKLKSSSLSKESKSKILDILTEYVELVIVTESDDAALKKAKENKRLLMVTRLSYEHDPIVWDYKVSEPPHKAQMPINIGTGLGYNHQSGKYLSIKGYAAYYDFLALDTARSKDSSITLLNTELRKNHERVWINKFELFNIAALNTNDVDLFPNDRLAWQLKAVVEPKDLSCTSCLRPRLGGYIGFAGKSHTDLSAYLMVGADLDASYIDESKLHIPIGLLYTGPLDWKTHLKVVPTWSNDLNRVDLEYHWRNRVSINPNSDIRINLSHKTTTEITMYYNYYF